MHFQRRVLLFVLLVIGISLVNDAFSPDYAGLAYWLQSEETAVDIESCLLHDAAHMERSSRCGFYAVVIDAGSTGTRLHLFEFTHDLDAKSAPFHVEKETFKEVKPGLSGFALHPEEAAESVEELLVVARETIPKSQWSRTPITLKATAGLRLLPSSQADAILARVEERVAASGFQVDDGAVGVMSGTDEGVFSWLTLNLLTDRLRLAVAEHSEHCESEKRGSASASAGSSHAAAALDLGGGSTQVTFAPKRLHSAYANVNKSMFSHEIDVFGNRISLYTHSYLGNGLVAARLGMAERLPRSTEKSSLVTHCFPPGLAVTSVDYTATQWNITGSPISSFDECVRSAQGYIRKSGVKRIPELMEHDVYAFSYFCDRGLQADLVPRSADSRGGHVTVGAFKHAAARACSRGHHDIGPEHWSVWQCLDLVYIFTLLHDGYGLHEDKPIYLAKRLRDMEMSWALGASYSLVGWRRHRPSAPSADAPPDNSSSQLDVHAEASLVDSAVEFLAEHATTALVYLRILS